MRIKDVTEATKETQNLLEQGERAQQYKAACVQKVGIAHSNLQMAYANLEAAKEPDEEGRPKGNVDAAHSAYLDAMREHTAAQRELEGAYASLERIHGEKLETASAIQEYTAAEEKNLALWNQLSGKKFGANINMMVANLADRMNASEQLRERLLSSIGQSAAAKTYMAAAAAGEGVSGGVSDTGADSSGGEGSYASGSNNFFSRMFQDPQHEYNMPMPGMHTGGGQAAAPSAQMPGAPTAAQAQSGQNQSGHSTQFGAFSLNEDGFVMGEHFAEYESYLNDSSGKYIEERYDKANQPTVMVNPNSIEGVQIHKSEQADWHTFWNRNREHEVDSETYFKECASHIPEVSAALAAGSTKEQILANPALAACYSQYFEKDNQIELVDCGSYYEHVGNGRHRTLAARMMDADVPGKVVGKRTASTDTAHGSAANSAPNRQADTQGNTSAGAQPSHMPPLEKSSAAGAQQPLPNNLVKKAYLASSLTNELNADTVNLGNLSVEKSEFLADSLSQAGKDLGELDIRFVGSTQQRNMAIEKDYQKLLIEYYTGNYKGASESEIVERAASDVLNLHEKLRRADSYGDPVVQTLDPSVMTDLNVLERDVLSKYKGITVDENFSDFKQYYESKSHSISAGNIPQGCGMPKAVIDYEIGRKLSQKVNAAQNTDIQQMYEEFKSQSEATRAQMLSRTAAGSIEAFTAQAWTSYNNNPQCSEFAADVAKKVQELYDGVSPPQYKKVRRR